MFPEKMAKDYVTVFKTERKLYPLFRCFLPNFISSFAPTPCTPPLFPLVGIPATTSKLFFSPFLYLKFI